MIELIGFSYKRHDGYFRLVIGNVEYEGAIDPLDPERGFEYFESKFRVGDKINALRELEAINGGKLKRIQEVEKSKNEKILKGLVRLNRW